MGQLEESADSGLAQLAWLSWPGRRVALTS